ncbi:MAG: hypothetical protein K1X94_12965 [Sandaracinaceae bacterium]|nr:hypothetical protein [Sandaracinaceae bacterium]
MHVVLPAYGARTQCDRVGLALDRVVLTDDGPRERCVVPALTRREIDSARPGFFYDDFESDLLEACGEAAPQALTLTQATTFSPARSSRPTASPARRRVGSSSPMRARASMRADRRCPAIPCRAPLGATPRASPAPRRVVSPSAAPPSSAGSSAARAVVEALDRDAPGAPTTLDRTLSPCSTTTRSTQTR